VHALGDARVVQSIESRLERGATLTGIHALGYNFATGLIHIYFEFMPGGIALKPDAVLVVLDSENRIVGVVDPFDPIQPNRLVPPLPHRGEQPFVLARPSITQSLFFTAGALDLRDAANREFYRKLQKGRIQPLAEGEGPPPHEGGEGEGEGGGGEGEGGGGEGEGGGGGTQAPYSTVVQTFAYQTGTLRGIFTGQTDVDSNPDYEPDGQTDWAPDA
jgi:hypothetical protein